MGEVISDAIAPVAQVPTTALGTFAGWDPTRDDKLSTIMLNVHYLTDTAVDLGTARIRLDPGRIRDAVDLTHAAAVIAAGNPEPGDPEYPVKPDAEAAWTAALNRINQLVADPAITTIAQMAAQLVTLLASAGPNGQKWGRRILAEEYRAQVK